MTNMHTRQQKSVTCEKLARVSIFLPHIFKSWPEFCCCHIQCKTHFSVAYKGVIFTALRMGLVSMV